MAQPYVGEIRMFGGNFAPVGWMLCQGQTLPISENEVLFQLIGTTYGGDGERTFNLPNLAGRVQMHQGTAKSGTTYQMGEMAGTETVTITQQTTPTHNHAVAATQNIGGGNAPANSVLAQSTTLKVYGAVDPSVALGANTITPTGGSQPHENLQPYLCINFIISLFGVFPSQT